MSQNSPAKHERIQRHLMRQRGAGAREINADFGFSFAGFSAPSSQDATPSEPPPKRRKTSIHEVEVEVDEVPIEARRSVLDRRGRTKAAQVKRRFVEEEVNQRRVSGGNEEDSFVAGLGSKKRARKDEVAMDNTAQSARIEVPQLEGVVTENPRRARKKDDGKPRRTKAAQTAPKLVDEMIDTPEPELVTVKTKVTKGKPRAKGKGEDHAASDNAEPAPKGRQDVSVYERVIEDALSESKPRKRATAKKRKIEQSACHEIPERTLLLESGDHEPVGGPAPRKPSRKRKQSVAVLQDAVEQGEEPTAKKARKLNTTVSCQDAPLAPEGEAITKKARKATNKSKAADKTALESTPPRLQRRPLQQGDINRSPSPRKSPDKPAQPVGNGHDENDIRGLENDQEKDIFDRRNVSRHHTREQETSCVDPNAELGSENKAPVPKSKGLDKAAAGSRNGGDGRKLDEETASSTKVGSSKTTKAGKASKQPRRPPAKPARECSRPATTESARRHTSPDADDSIKQDAADEDIDWLFAAPQARPKPAPKAISAKPNFAPRKAKLTDIDLDDLIASVATFAHAGGDVGSEGRDAVKGSGKGCKGWKSRIK